MVMCLARDKGSSGGNVFYSGGKDGYLVIWKLEPNALIMSKKISIMNSMSPLEKQVSMSVKDASFTH